MDMTIDPMTLSLLAIVIGGLWKIINKISDGNKRSEDKIDKGLSHVRDHIDKHVGEVHERISRLSERQTRTEIDVARLEGSNGVAANDH